MRFPDNRRRRLNAAAADCARADEAGLPASPDVTNEARLLLQLASNIELLLEAQARFLICLEHGPVGKTIENRISLGKALLALAKQQLEELISVRHGA